MQEVSTKIDELLAVQEEKEREIESLSKIKETRTKTYQTFRIVKRKLKDYGIGMENIDQVVKCIVGISKQNYNPIQILTKITDYENLEKNSRYYNEQVNLKKDELAKLNQDIFMEQNKLNSLKIKLAMINELKMMGFGITEFRTLSNMLNEIGEDNKESFDGIRKKFFDDVKNYEEVIGSRKEIDRLKQELKDLEAQTMKEREKYNANPQLIYSIIRLAIAGIFEDDVVKIDKILSMTGYYYSVDKDTSLSSKETLIDDLQKYGNLKLAIKNLEDIEMNLKSKKKRILIVQPIKKGSITVKKTKRKKSGN
jgi:hypothetical protein